MLANLSVTSLDNLRVTSVPVAVVSISFAVPLIPNEIPPLLSNPKAVVTVFVLSPPAVGVTPSAVSLIVLVFNAFNCFTFTASLSAVPSPTFVNTLFVVTSVPPGIYPFKACFNFCPPGVVGFGFTAVNGAGVFPVNGAVFSGFRSVSK